MSLPARADADAPRPGGQHPPHEAIHHPLGQAVPDPGRSLEVATGVRWLRMPLPFALDHINLWLLRDHHEGREGWTLVDCGIDCPATRAAWEQVIAHELQGLPLLRVVVTHMHPDHIGLAHWLTQRFSTPGHECRLWISATDWCAAQLACRAPVGFGGEDAARFQALHGLADAATLARVRGRAGDYARMVPAVPPRYRRLHDGLVLQAGPAGAQRQWQCIAGLGHAPEHIALHAPGDALLIAGDMLLPRISTNVSVQDVEPEGDPLALFLQALRRMQSLPPQTLVLPSHGRPFTGVQPRVAQLLAHHEERLAEVLQACSEAPRSAFELLPLMFRRALDAHQTLFAMGEAVAHLHRLQAQGLLHARDGADGVRRFAPTHAAAQAARGGHLCG